jgi:hypothetical protein
VPGEPAESRFERGEEGVQIALHAELGAHREGLSAGLRDRADYRLCGLVLVRVVDGHQHTIGGQALGDGSSDAA